jgi:hypothetical protein
MIVRRKETFKIIVRKQNREYLIDITWYTYSSIPLKVYLSVRKFLLTMRRVRKIWKIV